MSLVEKMSSVRPTNGSGLNETVEPGQCSPHQLESGPDYDMLEFEEESPCGSMALGKQRNADAALVIEPEKHLSPRAASKEFTFPKSN